MLYLFLVNEGNTVTLQMDLALETVAYLKQVIER